MTSFDKRGVSKPSHLTVVPLPTLVYPVLHVQTTANVTFSCEHSAFLSQPPLFTLQLSREETEAKSFIWKFDSNCNWNCTFAFHYAFRPNICISGLASADNSECILVMRTDCVLVTASVIHIAAIYGTSHSSCICNNQMNILPSHFTTPPVPTLVYPVLQVQTTANVSLSCEQTAFLSQPPLLTVQLSVTENRRLIRTDYHNRSSPSHFTVLSVQVLMYPVLHVQMTANVVLSCEQVACLSQPPLFTLQLSEIV